MINKRFEKKRLFLIPVRVLLLFGVFTGIYIFGYLGPKYQVFRALAEVEKRLVYSREALLENHLAIFELAGLNPEMAGFAVTKERLLETIQRSRSEAIKRASEGKPSTKIPGLTGKQGEMYNTELISFDQESRRSQITLLEEQEVLLKKLMKIDSAAGKLLGYVPEKDLGGLILDNAEAREELAVRIAAAGEGVGVAVERISGIEGIDKLKLEVMVLKGSNLRTKLSDLKEGLSENRKAKSEMERQKVIKGFNELKGIIFGLELDCLNDELVVRNLTAEVNLLHKYEYWLKAISTEKVTWFRE